MTSLLHLVLVVLNLGLAKACTVAPLYNGGFETGKFAPWTPSVEYMKGLPATTITKTAHAGSQYAANLSLIYRPSDTQNGGRAPLINLLQRVNACGTPQDLSLWYNVQPDQVYQTTFNLFIYDVVTHHVFANAYVYYNSTSDVDSRGKQNGAWHKLGPFHFKPLDNDLILSVVVDGVYNKTHGTSTVLVDDIRLEDSTV